MNIHGHLSLKPKFFVALEKWTKTDDRIKKFLKQTKSEGV